MVLWGMRIFMIIAILAVVSALPLSARADNDGWPANTTNPFDEPNDDWSNTFDQNDRKEDRIGVDAPKRNSSLDNEWSQQRKRKRLSDIQGNQLKSRYGD